MDKLRDIGSSVRDTGAIGDGRADDTRAIQEIADYFARTGGEWFFPEGIFKTTAPLVWNGARPQRIRGRGKRGVYPGHFDPTGPTGLAVIMPVHAGRAAVRFVSDKTGDGSIEVRDLSIATLERGAVPEAAFLWDTSYAFLRNFAFSDCSIHGFGSAFDVIRTGGANAEVGMLRVQRCTINRNRWIARTLNGTQWNGFSFCENEAGQNGYNEGDGGIAIAAHQTVIGGNCLEGQRDAVRLFGAMQGASIRDNYFEANVGTAAIHLRDFRGPYEIGPNSFLAVDPAKLGHNVLLTNCGPGRVDGPYWADGVHKTPPPVLGGGRTYDNTLNPRVAGNAHGILRFDTLDRAGSFLTKPRATAIATMRVVAAERESAPWNGQPMPVAVHDTTTNAALMLDCAIAGASGDWAVMTWLFKRLSEPASTSDPYVSFSIDNSGAPGSRDYVAYGYDQYWSVGEWCLLTAAIRLQQPMSRLGVHLYPYGIKAPAGRRIQHLMPAIYVTDSVSQVRPFIDDFVARSVFAPPLTAGFKAGDILINAAPKAAGQASFVKLEGGDKGWAYA